MRRFIPGFLTVIFLTSSGSPLAAQGASPQPPSGAPPFVIEEPKIPPPPSTAPAAPASAAPPAPAATPVPAAPGAGGEPLLTFQADTSGYATSAEIEGVLLSLEGLKTRIEAIETRLQAIEDDVKKVEVTANNARSATRPTAGGGGNPNDLKEIKQKLQELSSKYQSHSHDYLIEVRDRGGGVSSAQQGALQGGQSATGRVTIGKPK